MLMFQNAMIYNTKDSEVYSMAVTLKKFAVKEMEAVFTTEELLKSPHPVTRCTCFDSFSRESSLLYKNSLFSYENCICFCNGGF